MSKSFRSAAITAIANGHDLEATLVQLGHAQHETTERSYRKRTHRPPYVTDTLEEFKVLPRDSM
ncbi:MAG: hypothetical protein QM630_09655 [Microbacterium sp.]